MLLSHPMPLHVLDPLDGLALRVHHQRPAVTGGHYHTVLRGEGIGRQTLDIPVSDGCRLPQESGKGEVGGTGDLQLANLH